MTSTATQQEMDVGVRHHQAGRLADAEGRYRHVLRQEPNHPDALHLLGLIAHQVGRHEAAVDLIRQAITIQPNYPEAHSNLGVALRSMGQLDEAIAACRQAIVLRRDYPEAYYNLGNALRDQGQPDEAIDAYRQAVALKHNFPEAHGNLGVALMDKGQSDEAISALRQAIALNHNYAEARSNLGLALRDNGQLDEAVTAYRQAIALKYNYAEAHLNLGNALLLQGNFLQGWKEYEWRWQMKLFKSRVQNIAQPFWDGSDLAGSSVLFYAEQGFGDTIQFIRYAPLVASRGGKVLFLCQPELRRLLQGAVGVARWLPPGEPLPAFDLLCPLLSLPRAFGTTLQTVPQSVPYVQASPEALERWRKRLRAVRDFKVGLVWAGNPAFKTDRARSPRLLSLFAPLGQVPDAQFFSLQKGEAAKQASQAPAGMRLTDWTNELDDFAETAALIANLDLVISSDTAVAHLAGAMGKPVWTLLSFVPDWRWMLEREDSPWYPTMRLFRQPRLGDWESVIRKVADSLGRWLI